MTSSPMASGSKTVSPSTRHQDLAAGEPDAGVQRGRLAGVLLSDHEHVGQAQRGARVGGAVGRAVVDDDDLDVRIVAGEQGRARSADVGRLVVGGDDHRHRADSTAVCACGTACSRARAPGRTDLERSAAGTASTTAASMSQVIAPASQAARAAREPAARAPLPGWRRAAGAAEQLRPAELTVVNR